VISAAILGIFALLAGPLLAMTILIVVAVAVFVLDFSDKPAKEPKRRD
jgi:uncharacterized protein YpmS